MWLKSTALRSGPAQYTFAFTLGGRSADTSGWRFQVVDPLGADGRSDPGDLIANPVDNDYEITQDNGVVRVTVNRANPRVPLNLRHCKLKYLLLNCPFTV